MMKKYLVVAILLLASTAAAEAQEAGNVKFAERVVTSRVKGRATATVSVVEIADFQCPFCARFSRDIFPRIDSAFVKTGRVQWIFVNFPLPNHANSWTAAEAAMCAGGVSNHFWPMHDKIFATQSEWAGAPDPAGIFEKYAKEIGVPLEGYKACVANDQAATLIVSDLLNSTRFRVTGTPAFVVNNEPSFTGLRSFEEWSEILENAIKKAATAK